jgi:hypothetical protein
MASEHEELPSASSPPGDERGLSRVAAGALVDDLLPDGFGEADVSG